MYNHSYENTAIIFSSAAEPHYFNAAMAQGKIFTAAPPAPVQSAYTTKKQANFFLFNQSYLKHKFL
jgi:hypothetical protein